MLKSMLIILCCWFPLWNTCATMSWIRHRWIQVIFKTHVQNAEKYVSDFNVNLSEYEDLLYPTNVLCDAIIRNFRLYMIGEDESGSVNQVLQRVDALRQAALSACRSNPPIVELYTKELNVKKITCISTRDFILSILFIPFMASPKYIHVSIIPSSFSREWKYGLFALTELDGIVEMNPLQDSKELEETFLASLHERSPHPNDETLNINYDICEFDVDDHFRLCSTSLNSIMKHLPPEKQSHTFYMPESRMYNLCSRIPVNFRHEHLAYDTKNIRVKMVSCQLSAHQFYLVANSRERGAVFVLSNEIGNSETEVNYVMVDTYVRFLPILMDYGYSGFLGL